jgi:hypothetical protein
MTLKALIIKILIIVGILFVLFIIALLYTTRRVNTDISNKEPYNKIVDKTYTTKQVCYIDNDALTGKKSTAYSLRMKTDNFIEIPIGTAMKIKKAVSSYGAVSGFTSEYLEGTIYVKELNREVKFHYNWRDKKYFSDKKYYYVYELSPWQNKRIPYKFTLDGVKSPYSEKDGEIGDKKLHLMDINGTILQKGNSNHSRIFVINGNTISDNTIQIRYKFNHFENALDNFDYSKNLEDKTFFLNDEEIAYLNLKTIENDLPLTKIFPIDNIKLSDTYNSRILSFVNDKEINVKLINFSNDEKIIDTLTIFQTFKGEETPRKHTKYLSRKIQVFEATEKIVYKEPKIYRLEKSGKIVLKNTN